MIHASAFDPAQLDGGQAGLILVAVLIALALVGAVVATLAAGPCRNPPPNVSIRHPRLPRELADTRTRRAQLTHKRR